MVRIVLVVMLAGLAAACASSRPGACDPAEGECACDADRPCPSGWTCGPTGLCVADLDAAVAVDAEVDAAIDAPPGLGFGEPCMGNRECESGVCIFVGTGGRCTRLCSDDCPTEWGCYGVIDVIDPGEIDNVCVPVVDSLCTACSGDAECTTLGMDRCLTYPDGDRYCSRDCSRVGCPSGYSCNAMTIGGTAVQQCVPNSGACDCDARNPGMMEACSITTPLATTCAGMRTCGGATGWGTCQPPATTDLPDGTYADANCDGIDGEYARGVFVAGGGANTATCGLTHTTPCQTISHGIVRAVTESRNHVFVQAGTYNEVVVLLNGVNVWGGYNFAWQRASYATPGHRVEIVGRQDTGPGGDGEYLAVRAHDLIVPVTLGDLVITGPAAAGDVGGDGRSSYAVHVDAATVRLERVSIVAGDGAPGAPGSVGQDAVIVDAQSYMNGGRGGDGREYDTACDTSGRGAAGPAGTNTCTGSPSSRATDGGAGGAGGTMDTSCGFSGSCAVSGNCDARAGANGSPAAYRNGSFGAPGTGGSGLDTCGPTTGGGPGEIANGGRGGAGAGARLVDGYWYANGGGAGGTGENGSGGGGGGGGGGCDVGTDAYGAGGGGGGAGGCAARGGGGGGGGGGGSFGVFAVGNASVTISGCAVARGAGGRGGNGGVGGRGQSGGAGNSGGAHPGSATPGTGAAGAHGGHGGGGGGGQGGRSAGLTWTPGSTVVHDCAITGGSAGARGDGGLHAPAAPAVERDGNDGANGTAGTLQTTRTCASATSC